MEFEGNHDLLVQARAEYRQRYLEATRFLDLVDNGTTIDEAEFDQLVRAILTSKTNYLESGAHSGLLASGRMDVIRDESLRSSLAAWPSYVAEWSEEDAAVFSFVADVIEPFLLDRTRLRSVTLALATFPDGDAPPPISIESMDPASRAFLSTSLEFENLVVLRARSEWYALRDAETLIVQLSTILSLIRQNVDE